MRKFWKSFPRNRDATLLLVFTLFATTACAQQRQEHVEEKVIGGKLEIPLTNNHISVTVVMDENILSAERFRSMDASANARSNGKDLFVTDAGFSAEIMWTGWNAPGRSNNAENPVVLTQADFKPIRYEFLTTSDGTKQLRITLKQRSGRLHAFVTYQLPATAFYVRRGITLVDSLNRGHFIEGLTSIDYRCRGNAKILNNGGFGQPIALALHGGGIFAGIEYPAADNLIERTSGGIRISCTERIGTKITASGTEGKWCVIGITPDTHVKLWFDLYLDDIRVAPLRPYTLYNSWYDLRSTEYPGVPEESRMNEGNILRIINRLRTNMVERHGITLDAFVLDDGWDIYESDWELRGMEFPRGLKPIVDELQKTNTALGIWFGPTGGYSFRSKRLNWMREHGYELTGPNPGNAMLCTAGRHYSPLFRKRTTDFVTRDRVGYFKWDGIQFSCSEPDHGHPVGVHSRKAVMDSLIDKCLAVRSLNPALYLNITSGTWLSPWWVQYANQIWMQGSDYGYADVPSISPRDAAITYRDFVLFDDFRKKNFWFPISNLMTHGIIKGTLQMLGGIDEPLDRFTNEVILYFARGVSMWELYISPDIMTEGEWNAMSRAMHWARDRFPTLMRTEMIGGDPTKRETYGYLHLKGKRGVVAARNPWIEPGTLKVELSTAYGLEPEAASLVVERVYPRRHVERRLYRAGESFVIHLDGYETALYEIYPLVEAKEPLVAGVDFESAGGKDKEYTLNIYPSRSAPVILNPSYVVGSSVEKAASASDQDPVTGTYFRSARGGNRGMLDVRFSIDSSVQKATLALLVKQSAGRKSGSTPNISVHLNGTEYPMMTERGEGRSRWHTTDLPPGSYRGSIRVGSGSDAAAEMDGVDLWMICLQKRQPSVMRLTLAREPDNRPMPPAPFDSGIVSRNIRIGSVDLRFRR